MAFNELGAVPINDVTPPSIKPVAHAAFTIC